jgi:hypothetical protein
VREAQLEVTRLVVAACQRRRLGGGALAIVGVNELEIRTRAQFVRGPAERAFPRGVGMRDVAVEPGGYEEVDGEAEEARRDALDADGGRSARTGALCPRPWVQSAWGTNVVRYA